MTLSVRTKDTQLFTTSLAAGLHSTAISFALPTDGTVLFRAIILVSHFSGGHQDAGGSLGSNATIGCKNGVCALIPAMAGISSALGTNPLNDYTEIPPTADTIIAGTAGTVPWTAVWSVSGTNALLTITNQTGSTAGFDFLAWVDIYTVASQ